MSLPTGDTMYCRTPPQSPAVAPSPPYALGLLSPIPVILEDGRLQTLDLWARDLEVQAGVTSRLRLFCPTALTAPAHWSAVAPLPPGIEVVGLAGLRRDGLRAALAGCDVVQVPGTQGWSEGRAARRLVRCARHLGIRSVVGISSNRALAATLNACARGPLARLRGWWTWASVRLSQRRLTAEADGTFVVGAGLRPLVSPRCPTLHVSIASWIREDDLAVPAPGPAGSPTPGLDRLCIASRLDRMKGVHLGVEAFTRLAGGTPPDPRLTLTILGAGPELAALQAQVQAAGLAGQVRFGGTRPYPTEFFEALRQVGLVLLTNLSDEQPRLVFDAISQGCLPVCPDSAAYTSLGLPRMLLYRQGDVESLVAAVERLRRHPELPVLWRAVRGAARAFTLEAMHRARASWIEAEVLGLSRWHAPAPRSTPRPSG